MMVCLLQALLLALAPGQNICVSPAPPGGSPLDWGYRQMYDLQFDLAHRTIRSWELSQPDDPMGPTSDAAAFLFSEFDRLGVLQSELFVDEQKLWSNKKLTPDPSVKAAFERALANSEQLAAAILARSPQDPNALFAKIMNLGLRSDYLALIEKRYLASLVYMKNARIIAEKLLAIDRSNYDVYLAIGIENYLLGSKPAPVRWALRLYGAEVDKKRGLEKLRLTAEKGHYLLPFARLLLAVAALRDRDRDKAKQLLSSLARDFPNNPLYAKELAKLQ